MDAQTTAAVADSRVARSNHEQLATSGVFAVNLIGGPGCGKTSLLEVSVRRLILKRRVGIIAADPHARYDADRLAALGDQVIQVDTAATGLLTAYQVRAALDRMTLGALDLLLIENVSSLIGPEHAELGDDATVAVFSVAAGADKPAKYPDVVGCADLVVLNKVDLLPVVPFDLEAFRATVRRIKPGMPIIELSTLTNEGVDCWVEWLLSSTADRRVGSNVPPAVSPSGASA